MITSKARVAPTKHTTIPRLELSAAHLLSKLLRQVVKDLAIPASQFYCWTDSAIALCWIKGSPSNLKVYVANRVAAIHEMTSPQQWRHVRSKHNPEDLASRGTPPSELPSSTLWWKGPPWLSSPPTEWPVTKLELRAQDTSEFKKKTCHKCTVLPAWNFLEKYSSFHKLTRVLAWIKRFVHNVQCAKELRELSLDLTSKESSDAMNNLLQSSQRETYTVAFECVEKRKLLPNNHPLSRYDLVINKDGLLCVTGRVRSKDDTKSPRAYIPLSIKSPIVRLYLHTMHVTLSHPGIATMMAILAEDHVIPHLRNHLKLISRHCVFCQRAYARTTHQRMGMLPLFRTEPAPPFSRTGIDFAGPFLVHRGNPRKPTRVKVYAALFVCFTTKAVHLELCSDLTAEAFLAALTRFCARIGTPLHLITDNGSNFLGAKKELEEVQKLLNHPVTTHRLSRLSTEKGLQWHLSPPRAPHFGGLWEAGVKAMKTLLRKVVGSLSLSFEELTTVLAEAEAVLNSRPLIPLNTNDPGEDLSLTAGHFLIGRPLCAPPQARVDQTTKLSNLKRWNLVRRLNADLWKLWKGRYLQSLIARAKWKRPEREFHVNDIVIIKDDETFGHRTWPLARITKLFQGQDNLTRVVDLSCRGKTYRRSTDRLVLLVED